MRGLIGVFALERAALAIEHVVLQKLHLLEIVRFLGALLGELGEVARIQIEQAHHIGGDPVGLHVLVLRVQREIGPQRVFRFEQIARGDHIRFQR